MHIHLSAGNEHDVTHAPALIDKSQGSYWIADKGYDTDSVIDAVVAKNMTPVIPSKANRKHKRLIDTHIYKQRHRVENFFCKIKRYRRIATRYEKNAINYLGFVLFAAIRVWLA